jgi:hypothetical protein
MGANVFPTPFSGIQEGLIAAKGDLIVGTANDVPGILTVGTNGHTLVADSSVSPTGLKWAAPASGGMTVIASGTESSVATFTISSIPSGYVNLFLLMRSYTTAADNFEAYVRFNGDTSLNYNYASATSQGATAFGNSFIALGDGTDANNTNSLHQLTIYDYSNTVTWKMLQGNQVVADPTTATSMRYKYSNGFWNNTNAITSITILNGGSNLSVSYILYGVK